MQTHSEDARREVDGRELIDMAAGLNAIAREVWRLKRVVARLRPEARGEISVELSQLVHALMRAIRVAHGIANEAGGDEAEFYADGDEPGA